MPAATSRRVLCVFPRYTHSFGTLDHALPLLGVRAFMPPQGLLLVAGALPAGWEVRFVDENVAPVSDGHLDWAEVVFLSGMHVQRDHILELNARAQAHGRLTVLGGPSVSGCPEWYPEVDVLHVGELGDAFDALLERLAADVSRPLEQERYETDERRELGELPLPAYEQIRMDDYMMGSVQFSSGCPYRCEFCDIPELYGRKARLKTPERVVAELDAMLDRGSVNAVYFVDDNFVANPKAARDLVVALRDWQRARNFPVQFACEGTLNMSKRTELLELMREANFRTVFCGIETPDEDALRSIAKQQNLTTPILEAVGTLNGYGLEVVSGIILGLDSDTAATPDRIGEFIELSRIPMLTINILHALPRTPLWRRLEAEGRILSQRGGRDSNVEFLLPREVVVEGWRRCVERAYAPEAIYARYEHQMRTTYTKRLPIPFSREQVRSANLRRGLRVGRRLIWHVGIRSDYRGLFWGMARRALRRGQIEELIHVALVSHHMIQFAREAVREGAEHSFYAADEGAEPVAAAA